jgi:hypothetical protein
MIHVLHCTLRLEQANVGGLSEVDLAVFHLEGIVVFSLFDARS